MEQSCFQQMIGWLSNGTINRILVVYKRSRLEILLSFSVVAAFRSSRCSSSSGSGENTRRLRCRVEAIKSSAPRIPVDPGGE